MNEKYIRFVFILGITAVIGTGYGMATASFDGNGYDPIGFGPDWDGVLPEALE